MPGGLVSTVGIKTTERVPPALVAHCTPNRQLVAIILADITAAAAAAAVGMIELLDMKEKCRQCVSRSIGKPAYPSTKAAAAALTELAKEGQRTTRWQRFEWIILGTFTFNSSQAKGEQVEKRKQKPNNKYLEWLA